MNSPSLLDSGTLLFFPSPTHARTLFWVEQPGHDSGPLWECLRSAGYHVRTFSHPLLACLALEDPSSACDVMILNAGLDSLQGLWFADELRGRGFSGKWIVLTGDGHPVVTLSFQQRFADRILHHPVLPSTLLATLDELFEPEWVAGTVSAAN